MTIKQVETKVNELNNIRGFEKEVYSLDETGKFKANANVFYVDKSYGGYSLNQVAKNGKGSHARTLRSTKKELYEYIRYIIEGYYMAKRDGAV